MGLPRTTRSRGRASDDSGFTLVEAVVALFVLGIIFTALAMAAMGSIRASMSSRAEQQAIDFATEALEQARQADYYSLGHDATDVAADSTRVTACGTSSWCFNPGDGAETLVTMVGGTINPHTTVVSSNVNNGVNFSVSTYVTKPAGTSADYKRVTVVTRWTVAGKARERVTSSIVTATTRGLPIPLFTFKTASNSQTVNPGAATVFKIEMTNQGAPDRWDLSTNNGTWTLWRDNGDSILCMDLAECGTGVTLDTQLTDGDDPGTVVDTGRLDPTSSLVIWAVRDGASNSAVGDIWTNLTATAVSVDHEGIAAGVGVKTIALLSRVTATTVTQSPGPVTPTPVAPSVPLSLAVTIGDGQLDANWLTPEQPGTASLSDYKIEYRRAIDLPWITESDISTALTRTITGLTNGTLYDIRVAAVSSAGVSAWATAQGTPTSATTYAAPSICAATNPSLLPVAASDSGYTKISYTLHNRSTKNANWPGTGAPLASSTATQGVPLTLATDTPQFGAGTTLPVYSSDISTLDTGRVLVSGGSFTTASTATTQFVDWRTLVPGKQYSGTALLTFWIAPASGSTGTGYNVTAQLYKSTDADIVMDANNLADFQKTGSDKTSRAVSVTSASWCGGSDDWQRVAISFPLEMKNAIAGTESLGVRLWNAAGGSYSSRVRIAYDVTDDTSGRGFPATLTLPEK
jgi:type II secretory pathway pseudopilin PulG